MFKIYVFTWPGKPRSYWEAYDICQSLEKQERNSSLDYCTPDGLYSAGASFQSVAPVRRDSVRRDSVRRDAVRNEARLRDSVRRKSRGSLPVRRPIEAGGPAADIEPAFGGLAEGAFSGLTISGKSRFLSASLEVEFLPCERCENKPLPFIPLNIKTCQTVASSHDVKGGTLSDHWAQELTGSDLVREILEKTPAPSDKKISVAVLDIDLRREDGYNVPEDIVHGTPVRKLIQDSGPQAVLPETDPPLIRYFNNIGESDFTDSAAALTKKPPSFLNHSRAWSRKTTFEGEVRKVPEDKLEYDAFKKLSPPSVIVVAADNYFPETMDDMKSRASKDFDVIAVGNLSPDGFAASSSVAGEEIHILAPAGESSVLASADYEGDYMGFGGTSGAAPQVTGALAAFEWLSGYHPSAAEAKRLLEKTASPSLHAFEEPRRNGAGLLNVYRLGAVAQKLKEKCKRAKNDKSCIQKEIQGEAIYQFEPDPSLEKELDRAFPECSKKKQTKIIKADCPEKAKIFRKLRKAALLTPKKKHLWDFLGCIYKEAGFSGNSEALDKIAWAAGVRSKEEAANTLFALMIRKEGETSGGLLRATAGASSEREVVNQLRRTAEEKGGHAIPDSAVLFLAGAGGEEAAELILQMVKDARIEMAVPTEDAHKKGGGFSYSNSRRTAADVIRRKLREGTLNMSSQRIAEILIASAEPLESQAGEMTCNESESGFSVCSGVVSFSIPAPVKDAAEAAGLLGGKEGGAVLQGILEKNPSLDKSEKYRIIWAAGQIGGKGGAEILKELSQDPDEEIANEAKEELKTIRKRKNETSLKSARGP